jgi:hypothetical protein
MGDTVEWVLQKIPGCADHCQFESSISFLETCEALRSRLLPKYTTSTSRRWRRIPFAFQLNVSLDLRPTYSKSRERVPLPHLTPFAPRSGCPLRARNAIDDRARISQNLRDSGVRTGEYLFLTNSRCPVFFFSFSRSTLLHTEHTRMRGWTADVQSHSTSHA